MPTARAPSSLVTFFLTFVILHLLLVTPACSWFDKGHRVVGLIAQAHLNAGARSAVEKILVGEATLADASVWPDQEGRGIRDFNPLHYVSIPESAAGYDQSRDCPERNCMVEALTWFAAVVADNHAPVATRRLALRYVAHLVGDMHQPLHAGRDADRGGVEIRVSYRGQSTNLHYFWDRDLVDLEPGDEQDIARRLTTNLTETERRQWQDGDPKQWTNESFALVRTHAYNIGTSTELTDDYVEKARPIVRTRLVQAGLRLAWLLNRALP
jgi:hypothetical protein